MLLTDQDIAENAKVHLSAIREFLRYENALLGLHERKELVFGETLPETYPDPAQEAADQAAYDADEEARTRGDRETEVLTRATTKEKPAKPKKRGKNR